jgi:hypothetical protein
MEKEDKRTSHALLKYTKVESNHIWNSENTKTILRIPSSSTQKLTPFNTGIRKIRTKIHDKVCSNLRKLNPFGGTRFGKYEQKYLTCPIEAYASGSSHEEEEGVHKHQQEEEEEDEEEAVRDDETVP